MLEYSSTHFHDIAQEAAKILSSHFQRGINFSKIIQLTEIDRRNLILKLIIENPTTLIPASVILKKTTVEIQGETEQEQWSRFAHDWAGIEFLSAIGTDHAPQFWGASLEHQFILIEDLGEGHPSLVDPLTRASSPINLQKAEEALTAYVQRIGKMHADTFGKTQQFEAILTRVYPQTLRFHYLKTDDVTRILKRFEDLLGKITPQLQQEIEQIFSYLQQNDEFRVLLHGDICPDNVYFQGEKMRLIDFEYGDIGLALIDGVYLRMSMPSCWCSKNTPDNIIIKMETLYRNELKKKIETANVDNLYYRAKVYACAYWIIHNANRWLDEFLEQEWICPSGPLASDSKWDPTTNAFRPRMLSRLQSFIVHASRLGYLPVFTVACQALLHYLKQQWPQTSFMGFFPVFESKR